MKRFHLIVGIAALFAFILSGQYMEKVYNHLRGMADACGMLFRCRQVYHLAGELDRTRTYEGTISACVWL